MSELDSLSERLGLNLRHIMKRTQLIQVATAIHSAAISNGEDFDIEVSVDEAVELINEVDRHLNSDSMEEDKNSL